MSKVKAGDHGKKELKPTPTKNFKIGFYLKATLSVNIFYIWEPHGSVFIQKDGACFFYINGKFSLRVMFTKIMIGLHVLQLENLKNKPGNKPDVA